MLIPRAKCEIKSEENMPSCLNMTQSVKPRFASDKDTEMSLCLSVSLSLCLSVSLSFSLFLSVSLSLCLFVLYIYVFQVFLPYSLQANPEFGLINMLSRNDLVKRSLSDLIDPRRSKSSRTILEVDLTDDAANTVNISDKSLFNDLH